MSKLQFFLRAFLAAVVGATIPTLYWVLDVLGLFGADYAYDGVDLPLRVGLFLALPVCFVGALFAAGILKHLNYGQSFDRWYAGPVIGGFTGAALLVLFDSLLTNFFTVRLWGPGAAYGACTGLAVWLLFRHDFRRERNKT